ncbi:MAG: MFS transporter [Alphaproteobacteria bacterium]|nr:MFS transporter [Alphaproteobacteria bacterium]
MFEAFKSAWALFVGLAFIMLGNGLQGSLVAIRAQFEIFDNTTTGYIMAGYFAGFFIGSLIVPSLVARVGHVRVFGALASLSSLAILVFPVFIDPLVWLAMRIVTGMAYAGLYIVCESWLNDRATNETRGQMLAIYMAISLLGMAAGQSLLNLYSPADFQLFTVVSVLISLAVVPVLISAAKTPEFEAPERMNPIQVYRASPLGFSAMILVGVTSGAFLGMGPAYTYELDMSVSETSSLMSAIFIGGFIFTVPIGKLSDAMDRRTVILIVAAAGAVASGSMAFFGGDQEAALYALACLTGGFALPLYSLCIAHTNDFLTQKQMVAASSSMIMANGIGAVAGPNIAGYGLDTIGAPGLPLTLASAMAAIALFAAWRMLQRPGKTIEEQGAFVAMSETMTPVAASLNPESEPIEESPEDAEETVADEEVWAPDDEPADDPARDPDSEPDPAEPSDPEEELSRFEAKPVDLKQEPAEPREREEKPPKP